jgi:hypothetical protein
MRRIKKLTVVALCIFSLLLSISTNGQEKINKTTSFEVLGNVKKPLTIQQADLLKYKVQDIGDLVIYNHLGEKKGVQKGLKGVLLKEVLANLEFDSPSPKLLSEFYLTVKASDGYKVVFSWNELFNSPVGEKVYLIVEKESLAIDKMSESILLVTSSDYKTGRRNVKAVSSIDVRRI